MDLHTHCFHQHVILCINCPLFIITRYCQVAQTQTQASSDRHIKHGCLCLTVEELLKQFDTSAYSANDTTYCIKAASYFCTEH